MELIVSLPRNDLDLARAAESAGAHRVKVHMNVHHAASGTTFGSFAEEHDAVAQIMAAVGIPVGLMPGADPASLPTADELSGLTRAGLSFLDIYAQHMPLWFLDLPLKLIVALGESDGSLENPLSGTAWPQDGGAGRIEMCEASVFPKADYGQPFTFADFRRLRILQECVGIPLLVPTQKRITPDDARWLKRAGVAALMIGAVVAGDTADSIADATRAYRAVCDEG